MLTSRQILMLTSTQIPMLTLRQILIATGQAGRPPAPRHHALLRGEEGDLDDLDDFVYLVDLVDLGDLDDFVYLVDLVDLGDLYDFVHLGGLDDSVDLVFLMTLLILVIFMIHDSPLQADEDESDDLDDNSVLLLMVIELYYIK